MASEEYETKSTLGDLAGTIFSRSRKSRTPVPTGEQIDLSQQEQPIPLEEKAVPPEGQVAQIRNYIKDSDIPYILKWVSDPQTRSHLEPSPQIPQDPNDPEQVRQAEQKLKDYYSQSEDMMTPLVAVNPQGEPIGTVSIRFKEDPYLGNLEEMKDEKRGAVLERLIVDPDKRHMGIGTKLVATGINLATDLYKGYEGRGATDIYSWVMHRGDWTVNWNFFRKLGFRFADHYKEFAKKHGLDAVHKPDDDAGLFVLNRRHWREFLNDPNNRNSDKIEFIRNREGEIYHYESS